jgi:hypothetical protein
MKIICIFVPQRIVVDFMHHLSTPFEIVKHAVIGRFYCHEAESHFSFGNIIAGVYNPL